MNKILKCKHLVVVKTILIFVATMGLLVFVHLQQQMGSAENHQELGKKSIKN